MKTQMHISLYVSDLTKTIEFYNILFNAKPGKVRDKYAKYELDQPGLLISFIEDPSKVLNNFGHLGFKVSSNDYVISRMSELQNKGLQVLEEMQTNCCYAKQDKFWIQDPDGYRWEIYYFHHDLDSNRKEDLTEIQVCC